MVPGQDKKKGDWMETGNHELRIGPELLWSLHVVNKILVVKDGFVYLGNSLSVINDWPVAAVDTLGVIGGGMRASLCQGFVKVVSGRLTLVRYWSSNGGSWIALDFISSGRGA